MHQQCLTAIVRVLLVLLLFLPISPPSHTYQSKMYTEPHDPAPPPHTSPGPLPPSLPLHPGLRLGTFNVGRGFLKKLPSILARSLSLSLHLIALQEVGDPALLSTKFSQYFLTYAPGPSNQEAGVALLISNDLFSRCRSFKRSTSGRIVGVVMEFEKGQTTLIISCYMPSGLDHAASSSDATHTAHQLYNEMMQWSTNMNQVIIMGDLNQTLTRMDRLQLCQRSNDVLPNDTPTRRSDSSSASPAIHCLIQEHFTDVYRLLHPHTTGFTHEIISTRRHIRSRIDYIWSRGIADASHLHIHIDKKLHRLSHHHLLWMELRLQCDPSCLSTQHHPPMYRLRIPNLNPSACTTDDKERFIKRLDRKLMQHEQQLRELIDTTDSSTSLSSLATQLTQLTHHAAFSSLPLTGSTLYKCKSVLQLERQRRSLISLMHTSTALLDSVPHPIVLTQSPEWVRQYDSCVTRYELQWKVDLFTHRDGDNTSTITAAWLHETKQHIKQTRTHIRREKTHMGKQQTNFNRFHNNSAASIHRMLQSDALPSHLYSVIDTDGHLTSNAQELEDVMVQHFTDVFAIPSDPPSMPSLSPPPFMLFHKSDIQSQWYDGLMDAVSETELLASVKHTRMISSPGEDEVSTGVWKIAITDSSVTRSMVCHLFTACLQTSTFPTAWKTSVIVPLVKDTNKERTMSNIRPISLQSCLGKMLSNILAKRLGAIMSRHPILNPAQRGFIIGGATLKCIDELLDAWDWSRTNKKELYTLFYDIKQAYDSVQVNVIVKALRRLSLPTSFVALIEASLTGLSSCIRTAYGVSRTFPVLRSLRQGDPLAPLLFVILMDALHDGLEVNPFTHTKHGCIINGPGWKKSLSSLGYADDTAAITNTLNDLYIQNEWVKYFMAFNSMKLNQVKCELVGREADSTPLSSASIMTHNITINDQLLKPTPHGQPIRYLGVHSCFDGSWKPQQTKSHGMIMIFTRAAIKFNVPISHAVYMFNVFLLPKLELALHYVHGFGTSEWIKSLDRMLIGCIKHLSSSPLRLHHSALALTIHLRLPSWLEISIKVSELFLRMNSTDTRWSVLGRRMWLMNLPATIDSTTSLSPNTGTRFTRAAYLAVKKLNWTLHLSQPNRSGGRHEHLFDSQSIDTTPTLEHCTSSPLLTFIDHQSHAVHDIWKGWGTRLPSQSIDVYTDGSFHPTSNTSTWSVVPKDNWLLTNFHHIPSNEALIQLAHVGDATMFGSSITETNGIYPAELQAIARALAMFPLSFDVHIHTDSSSSLSAIQSYEDELNPRQRLRMQARPLLQLIHHQLTMRKEAGGNIHLSHIEAHSDKTSIDHVGNRLADFQANRCQRRPDRSWPLNLKQIPLSACEFHLVIRQQDQLQIIDDIRRTSLAQHQSHKLNAWVNKADHQAYFAGPGIIELGRVVLKFGSPLQQITLVHVATNSIHFHWCQQDDGTSKLKQLQCATCAAETMTLSHLLSDTCTDASTIQFRLQLGNHDGFDVINIHHFHECCKTSFHCHLLPRHHSHQLSSFNISLA
jgi:exonuclease III